MRTHKGRITREQTVWCWCTLNTAHPVALAVAEQRQSWLKSGDYVDEWECQQHHQEAGPVAGIARRAGWERIEPTYGWMCPPCIKAFRQIPAGKLFAIASGVDA